MTQKLNLLVRQECVSLYKVTKSDATVLSLLGSAVGAASDSVGTEAFELSDSAILFRAKWLRLMGYNIREENR